MRLTSTQVRPFTPNPVVGGGTQQVMYQVKGANEVEDTWEETIIDLAADKSIGGILDSLFSDEMTAQGAWVMDGAWYFFKVGLTQARRGPGVSQGKSIKTYIIREV